MGQWKLVDSSEWAAGPEEFPAVIIETEPQLRAELDRFKERPPAIIGLSSPENGGLQIGLGGALAGVRWGDYPRSKRTKTILADQQYSSNRVDFASEEDSLAFWPDELIPAEQAIEIVTHFYKHQELPAWVNWKEWDEEAKKWQHRMGGTGPNGAAAVPGPAAGPDRAPPDLCPTCAAARVPTPAGDAEDCCPHCGAPRDNGAQGGP